MQAVWALGNLVGDSGINRDMVLNHGALMPLLAQLDSTQKLSVIRSVTWALYNICHANPPCPFDQASVINFWKAFVKFAAKPSTLLLIFFAGCVCLD